jgi:hypothetical protein
MIDEEMTEEAQIKQWMLWYLEPPINVRKVYGDAFIFNSHEKSLLKILEAKVRGEK